MNIYKILLIILVIGTNSCRFFGNKKESCCPRLQHDYVEVPASFPELVQQAYLFRNDDRFPDLCSLLNDSIQDSPEVWLRTISEVDTINNHISWKLIQVEPFLMRSRDRFKFDVCITNENEIRINGMVTDISEIKEQAIEYIFYPDEEDRHIIIENIEVKPIGKIESSRAAVCMCRDTIRSYGLDEWKLFFDCMHESMLAFEYEMNKKSIDIWGISYDCLDCDKKEILLKAIQYNIIIDFFQTMVSYCKSPPPPPSPSPSRKP